MDLVTMVPGYEECHTLCQVREDDPNIVKVKLQRFFDSLGLISNTRIFCREGRGRVRGMDVDQRGELGVQQSLLDLLRPRPDDLLPQLC